MQYLGGKVKKARRLIEAMGANDRPADQWFVEPFCGAGGITARVTGKRIANDADADIVNLLSAVAARGASWLPDQVSEEEYLDHATDAGARLPPELVGLYCFGSTFGAKKWGGFGRSKNGNLAAVTKRSLTRDAPLLSGVEFRVGDYREVDIPPRSMIYCDPPYSGATGYGSRFDSLAFWDWAFSMRTAGHRVFVSEYRAPVSRAGGLRVVLEMSYKKGLRSSDGAPVSDKLYEVL